MAGVIEACQCCSPIALVVRHYEPGVAHVRIIGATPAPELVEIARRKLTPHITGLYALTETGVVAVADAETIWATALERFFKRAAA